MPLTLRISALPGIGLRDDIHLILQEESGRWPSNLPRIDSSCSPRGHLRVISDSYLGIGGTQQRDLDHTGNVIPAGSYRQAHTGDAMPRPCPETLP